MEGNGRHHEKNMIEAVQPLDIADLDNEVKEFVQPFEYDRALQTIWRGMSVAHYGFMAVVVDPKNNKLLHSYIATMIERLHEKHKVTAAIGPLACAARLVGENEWLVASMLMREGLPTHECEIDSVRGVVNNQDYLKAESQFFCPFDCTNPRIRKVFPS